MGFSYLVIRRAPIRIRPFVCLWCNHDILGSQKRSLPWLGAIPIDALETAALVVPSWRTCWVGLVTGKVLSATRSNVAANVKRKIASGARTRGQVEGGRAAFVLVEVGGVGPQVDRQRIRVPRIAAAAEPMAPSRPFGAIAGAGEPTLGNRQRGYRAA
jgi:hypothetical protein